MNMSPTNRNMIYNIPQALLSPISLEITFLLSTFIFWFLIKDSCAEFELSTGSITCPKSNAKKLLNECF